MKKALEGITVLDLSQIAAGPACSMFLGDLGADVIKVEPPSGEIGRMLGPPFINGESAIYLSVNRNKRGMAIDLKTPAGIDILHKLAKKCDVFLESFRPGVTKKLGIDSDTMRAGNAKLIYCSISAYGQSGPWKHKPGVDGIIQGSSGLMSIIGEESGSPCKVQAPVADTATAFVATFSILGALFVRERTGVGQSIDISLYNTALMLQQTSIGSYLTSGVLPVKKGSAAPYAAPNQAIRTKDGHIMVAAYQKDKWNALCKLTGCEQLQSDPRFSDNTNRVNHRAELIEILEKVFETKTSAEWLELLEKEEDILSGPVADYAQLAHSPQAEYDKIFIEMDHPVAGKIRMPGFGPKLDETPAAIYRKPPLLGEHTKEILQDFGFGEEEIRKYYEDKIVK